MTRKYTEYLNYNTASNILHAFDFSKYIGKPLNLFITINFYDDDNASNKFRKIRQLYSNWIVAKRKKSGATSYLNPWVYVFEKPHLNTHVHWVVHIEEELIADLYKRLEKWVGKYVGQIRANQIHFEKVNIFEDKSVANYLAKGANESAICRLKLWKYRRYQGFVKGQRGRVSLCLGKKARKKEGFKPSRDRGKWSSIHPHLMNGHVKPKDWNPLWTPTLSKHTHNKTIKAKVMPIERVARNRGRRVSLSGRASSRFGFNQSR